MSLHPSRCNGYVARRITVLAVALLLGLALAAPAVAAPRERPNLLVIMTDDQRADGTMEVMPKTRRKIGGQGRTFLEAYTTTPKCCPSRASFFTGQYPHNHRVISNLATHRLDHTTTVQRQLRRAGYRTGIFGKFLNGWPIDVNPPFFDEWAIMNSGYQRAFWNLDGRVRRKRRYTTDLVANRTARFLRRAERSDDQPWLAWVTPYAPHLPSTPAGRHRDAALPYLAPTPAMTETDWSDKPEILERARGFPDMVDTMRDDGRRSLMAVDDMVARLMQQLRRYRESGRTLVVFTSDNGFLIGEHGGFAGKDLPHPGSSRIPLLVRWPGRVRRGTVSTDPVLNIDVATTLLRAARLRSETDGRSLFAPRPRQELFLEHGGGRKQEPDALPIPAWRALLTPTHRYTEYYDGGEVVGREYYDRTIDPWELENRAESLEPLQLTELSAKLSRYATCEGRACP